MSHPCCICPKPAIGPYAGKSYCLEHRPTVGSWITPSALETARGALAQGAGLRETAHDLDVMSADLDLALWGSFGRAASARRKAVSA